MAEENSKPENEETKPAVAPEAAATEAPAAETPAAEAPAAEAPATDAPAGDEAAAGEEAAAEKPAELVGGVPKQPTAEDLLKEELGAVKIRKAKGSKNITTGVVNVLASFNNTIVSITDTKGNVISWASAGKCNFRGSRKSTAYAAQIVAQNACRAAMAHGLKDVVIKVNGPGLGRDSAVRAVQAIGLEVSSIIDVTPVPHNGCRPPKRRRV
jgi:small subunit ribosomal protein S11